jgi:hypothetical protein
MMWGTSTWSLDGVQAQTISVTPANGSVVNVGLVTWPGAPTGVSATAGNAQIAVSWSAPSSTAASSVSAYTLTASPGGATCSTTSTSCILTGLTNGLAYRFKVKATNAGAPARRRLPRQR